MHRGRGVVECVMATTIPGAVRHDTRQAANYQHQPTGTWILPTSTSPNLRPPEMPRTFGLPEPKLDEATVAPKMPWAPLESGVDVLVSDINGLKTELATTENNLRIGLAATLREHAQLIEMIVAQDQSTAVLERSESALAQVVLAAQQRAKRQAAKPMLFRRLRQKG